MSLMSDVSDSTENPNESQLPEFEPHELNVVNELKRIDSTLSNMYIGAKIALANKQNPERFRHAAVSMRQLIDDLPQKDKRVTAQRDVAGQRDQLKRFELGTTQAATITFSDDGQIDRLTIVKTRRVLAKVMELREYLENRGDMARNRQRALLDALDTARSSLPETDQAQTLEKWMKFDDYFNGVAHSSTTTQEEFESNTRSFESTLMELLSPSSAENLDEIDEFIMELEDE